VTFSLSVKDRIAFWAARENPAGTALKSSNKAGVTVISNNTPSQTSKSTPALKTTTPAIPISASSSGGSLK
jgi:hypothetical protein